MAAAASIRRAWSFVSPVARTAPMPTMGTSTSTKPAYQMTM
jgi:hypothetical protein